MGKLATASCGPETRRSQARPSGKDRNRSTAPLDETASGQRGIGNLTLQYSSARPQSSPVLGEGSFDPYLESVVDLTNRDLVDAILVTEDWLKKNGAVDPDHEAYTVRRDRLECERRARVERGHLWLETVHDRQSYRLFQLISGAHDALDVVAVENDELVNGPAGAISARPIMTEPQLQDSLDSRSIPTVTVADYLGRLQASYANLGGSGVQRPDSTGDDFADSTLAPNDGLAGAVSQSNVRGNLLQDAFSLSNARSRQGAIGEVYFGTSAEAGHGFGVRDYNAIPWTHPTRGIEVGNHPLVDYRTLFGARPEASVKTSTVGGADPFRRYGTYLSGYAQMMNTKPGYRGFDHYMNNAARGRTATQVRDQSRLIVNADDLAGMRSFVSDPFARETTPTGKAAKKPNYQRPALSRIYDGILQDRPLAMPDGTSLSTVAALDTALRNQRITAAQHRTTLMDAAQQAQAKIAPNVDLTRATLSRFGAARSAVPGTMSARDVRAAVSPEYMVALDRGGGWRGDLGAARSYGGRGALLGSLFGMGREGYSMLTDGQDNPDALWRLAAAGGREGLRGGASSGLETLAASRASRYALRRGLTASSGRALAARLGSRLVPGVVDALFEVSDVVREDRPHRPAEVGYRVGRAFVIGGTSALAGAAAGAWTGAAIGSAVFPGVGTVVGFLVGVVVGAFVGFVMNEIIPNYEQMVMEQVPLEEFKKNLAAQTPSSIQNQVLAEQELSLLEALVHGPQTRGPYDMLDVYQQRNLSQSPGDRLFDEAMIRDQVHGGCMDCHTRKAGSDIDARFGAFDEARLAPVDRMYLAAQEESGRSGPRPKFLDWAIPGQTVPGDIAAGVAGDPTAAVIIDSIDTIQPNFAGWREAMGSKGEGLIPRNVMNSPMDEEQLYNAIQQNIDARQWYFGLFFGEVGDAEYALYRNAMKKAQDEEDKRKAK